MNSGIAKSKTSERLKYGRSNPPNCQQATPKVGRPIPNNHRKGPWRASVVASKCVVAEIPAMNAISRIGKDLNSKEIDSAKPGVSISDATCPCIASDGATGPGACKGCM